MKIRCVLLPYFWDKEKEVGGKFFLCGCFGRKPEPPPATARQNPASTDIKRAVRAMKGIP